MSDSGVGDLSEDVMNHLIAGEDDHKKELAKLLNIDLNDQVRRTLIYAMEYMKYGNMNVIKICLRHSFVYLDVGFLMGLTAKTRRPPRTSLKGLLMHTCSRASSARFLSPESV